MDDVPDTGADIPIRDRIMAAAMELFLTEGYGRTTTLAIARRARVSKRDLYQQFQGKRGMLESCVRECGLLMAPPPPGKPPLKDRPTLLAVLTELAARIIREVSRPNVVALQRLAIAEFQHAPEIATIIDANGRQPAQDAIAAVVRQAQAMGLIGAGDADLIALRMTGLMWDALLYRLLMGVAEPPDEPAIQARAATAADALLRLYPPAT